MQTAVTRRPRLDLVKLSQITDATVNYLRGRFQGCQTRLGYTIEIYDNRHPHGQSGRPTALAPANFLRRLSALSAWLGAPMSTVRDNFGATLPGKLL